MIVPSCEVPVGDTFTIGCGCTFVITGHNKFLTYRFQLTKKCGHYHQDVMPSGRRVEYDPFANALEESFGNGS